MLHLSNSHCTALYVAGLRFSHDSHNKLFVLLTSIAYTLYNRTYCRLDVCLADMLYDIMVLGIYTSQINSFTWAKQFFQLKVLKFVIAVKMQHLLERLYNRPFCIGILLSLQQDYCLNSFPGRAVRIYYLQSKAAMIALHQY